MKTRLTARRSSFSPEQILDLPFEIPSDSSSLSPKESIFNRRKSYNQIDEDENSLKLTKSFNSTRRKSCIRFELGDLAVGASDEPAASESQVETPDVKISVDSFAQSNTDIGQTINYDAQIIELFVPTINIESVSVQNLAEATTDTIPLESIEEKLKSTETEPRRISIAVWSDPKLLHQAHKREECYGSEPKTMRKWTETAEPSFEEDESFFLNSAATDSLDELTSLDEVILHSLKYLNFVETFKIRGVSRGMAELISSKGQIVMRNVNFTPFFRKLNDKGLIAFVKLFGKYLEKINLHAGWQLTDRGIETLAKHSPNLLYLNLSEVWELTDSSLISIAKHCPSIEHLDISNCRKITNNGLLTILESCQISNLSLSYCKNLTNKVLDHDAWQRIKELNLHRCTGIADRGFEFWPLLVDEFAWCASRSIRQLALSTDWQLASEDAGHFGKGNMDDLNQDQTNLSNDDDNEWQIENQEYYDSDSKDILTSEYLSSQEGPILLVTEALTDKKKSSTFDLRSLDLRDCSFLSDTAIASIASVCSNLRILNLSFCCSLTEDFGRYLGKK